MASCRPEVPGKWRARPSVKVQMTPCAFTLTPWPRNRPVAPSRGPRGAPTRRPQPRPTPWPRGPPPRRPRAPPGANRPVAWRPRFRPQGAVDGGGSRCVWPTPWRGFSQLAPITLVLPERLRHHVGPLFLGLLPVGQAHAKLFHHVHERGHGLL